MNLAFSRRNGANTSKLTLSAVLDSGHIIFARNTSTNIRIVTFESAEDYFTNHTIGSTKRAAQTAIGKGKTIESAFSNALHSFNSGISYEEFHRRKIIGRRKSIQGTTHTSGILDKWLVNHKGTLRVIKDGEQVLCTLQGLKHPYAPAYDHITLRGSGQSLNVALQDAFAGIL